MFEVFLRIMLLIHIESWDSEIVAECTVQCLERDPKTLECVVEGDELLVNHGFADDFKMPRGEYMCIHYVQDGVIRQ